MLFFRTLNPEESDKEWEHSECRMVTLLILCVNFGEFWYWLWVRFYERLLRFKCLLRVFYSCCCCFCFLRSSWPFAIVFLFSFSLCSQAKKKARKQQFTSVCKYAVSFFYQNNVCMSMARFSIAMLTLSLLLNFCVGVEVCFCCSSRNIYVNWSCALSLMRVASGNSCKNIYLVFFVTHLCCKYCFFYRWLVSVCPTN